MPMKLKLFLGLLFILFGTATISAQTRLKMSVTSFEQDPFDTTPQNSLYEKIDGSGARYAIIKVTTDNPDDKLKEYNFNFGNLKSIVEEHDGELWVYVQKNAKMVTISRNGYITINKYDLNTTVDAGKTYVLKLSVARPVVYTQMVQFVVSPSNTGAVVTVKSSKQNSQEEMFGTTDATGSVAKALGLGTYTYKVIANNYHTTEGRFTLNDRTKTYKEAVTLRANFSEVTLKVNSDADIYLNNEMKGTRTWTGALRAGTYLVECRQLSHTPSSQYITVTENDSRTFNLDLPTPITGTLALTSSPLGAKINIDGKDYGVTPANINDLLTGSHVITISSDGYQSSSKTVIIQENQTTALNIAMNRIYSQVEKPRQQIRERQDEVIKHVEQKISTSNTPSISGYIQPAVQAGTMMGYGGNVGIYISNFNAEVFVTATMSKESVSLYSTSGSSSSDLDLSGLIIGGKVGYGIKVSPLVRITPQIGLGSLSIKGDDLSTSVLCATAGVRIEFALAKNFGISLTPEGQFAVGKQDIYESLTDVSSKIKGWGTGGNVRLGLYLYF